MIENLHLDKHLDDIYLVYSFSFLMLGATLFLQPKEDRVLSFSPFLYLIAFFGLLHGGKELLDWVKIAHPDANRNAIWLDISLLLSSYLFLFEFGRRLLNTQIIQSRTFSYRITIPVWIYTVIAVIILIIFSASSIPLLAIDNGIRITIGFTGAVMTGFGLILFVKNNAESRPVKIQLYTAAYAFIVYGISAGLIITASPDINFFVIDKIFFQTVTGIPIQLIRAICAIFIAISLANVLRYTNVQARINERSAIGKLKNLNERLELRVIERTKRLYSANKNLESEIEKRKIAQNELENTLSELRIKEALQRELKESAVLEQSRLYALLSAMNIGILFEDQAGLIKYMNPAFRKMWQVSDSTDFDGQPTKRILEKSLNTYTQPKHASRYVLYNPDIHQASERFEVEISDGRILTQLSYPVMDRKQRVLGRLWLFEDITNERQTAQQLLYLAERDALTGLYNRHRFQTQLEQMIANAQRSKQQFSLIYIDLDEFKHINDNFGHRSGDTVLVRVANELSKLIRADEFFARIGGDEFAILCNLDPQHHIEALPRRIVNAISGIPFRFQGQNLTLTVSVGVAIYPTHGDQLEDLVAHADTAMYQAKQQGKNNYAIYEASRDRSEVMVKRFTWNQKINQAIKEDLFVLHFQGVYSTKDKSLHHVEALIRMHDAEDPQKLIMPAQFIVVAEKSNLIVSIDRWVIEKCIEKLAAYPGTPGIAVNVSGRTIDDPSLPNFIRSLLKDRNVEPQRLILELTETAAVSDIQDAQRFIQAMQNLGCTVCLDDFGSGFATFSYLKHLNVKILKIDGQFIRDLNSNYENQAFVRAMSDVAKGLHKTCVAEFVENAETLAMLCDLGIELAQGFYLDRPSADHVIFK